MSLVFFLLISANVPITRWEILSVTVIITRRGVIIGRRDTHCRRVRLFSINSIINSFLSCSHNHFDLLIKEKKNDNVLCWMWINVVCTDGRPKVVTKLCMIYALRTSLTEYQWCLLSGLYLILYHRTFSILNLIYYIIFNMFIKFI